VAVKIKLKRLGKVRSPQYRIIVADAKNKRNGRAIEEIGKYQPKENPSFIEVNSERVQYWLGVGAQPTEPVQAILRATGDWQTFKGLPGGEGSLQTADAKADKKAVYEAALAEVHGESRKAEATTPKKKAKKAEPKKSEDKATKADDAKADDAKADEAKAETAEADDAKKGADDASASDAAAEAPAENA